MQPTTDIAHAQLAPVMEVFASVQGEGSYVGELQVFLRLAGCPLRCLYCDTPESWVVSESSGRSEWTSPFQATCLISDVEPGEPRTVSVTGGEPLLWPEFLLGLAKIVGPRPMHLETAGAHPQTLARVLDVFRHVSLDLKLGHDLAPPSELSSDRAGLTAERAPGSVRESAIEEWAEIRAQSLSLIRGRDACAKIVVCGGTPVDEYKILVDEVAEYAPDVPVIVQPATPIREVTAPRMADVIRVAEAARDRELSVRVLPQVHHSLGIR